MISSGKYLLTGSIAATLVISGALGVSALFDPETYQGWVAFTGIASVPALLICGVVWHYGYPAFATALPQPLRGAIYLGLTLCAMILGGGFLFFVPGQGAGPTPMLVNVGIMSVVTTFWVTVAWRCWPLSLIFKTPVSLGIAAWVMSYLLAYLSYESLFNFSAARHAPFYRATLDPAGPFDSWDVLVFSVLTSAVLVAFEKLFAFWPVLSSPAGQQAPLRFGVYASLYALVISAIISWTFLHLLHFEIVDFMLRVPVALIFGIFVVTNFAQSRLFATLQQPKKGFALLGVAILFGFALEEMYRLLAPRVAGAPLLPGPPNHSLELWVATALLGVTFPLIVLFTGYFQFWPLKRDIRPQETNAAASTVI